MSVDPSAFVHESAYVDDGATIGAGTSASAAPTADPNQQVGGQPFTVLLLGSDNDAKFSGNEVLTQNPALVNTDPFGDGWLFVLQVANADDLKSFMDAAAYKEQIG